MNREVYRAMGPGALPMGELKKIAGVSQYVPVIGITIGASNRGMVSNVGASDVIKLCQQAFPEQTEAIFDQLTAFLESVPYTEIVMAIAGLLNDLDKKMEEK